ncbi:MAG: threonine-phosphate decarboxylase CobD [Alphaproteobacteria bacterium]
MSEIRHGGDLTTAETRYGKPKDGWLDLSTGINPQPYPFLPPDTDAWHRLPQRAGLDRLIDAAAKRYGAANRSCIVAAPGSQTILQWLPRLLPPTRVLALAPTYGEYVPTWRAGGHDARLTDTLDAARDAAVVVLANPNNPDGRRHAPETLLALAAELATRGGWLLVDEAFADADPEISVARHAGMAGLVVLRSLGKFYGLAGLRLGFALAPADLAAKLAAAIGPWAVSGPALAIGAQALEDSAWTAETRDRLALASARLAALLLDAGCEPIGGTALFQLARHARAAALQEHLGRQGILVRSFESEPDRLRFGLPAARDLPRLAAALAAFR